MQDPTNQNGPSLKRTHPRAKQSCTRCRKHKLKCSGEVPCERCVRRNEQDSCELWHRVNKRQGVYDTWEKLQKLQACAYYIPVLLKIASDFVHREMPPPELVVQLARLWLMVLVHQKGVNKEFAKQKISGCTMIPLVDFQVCAYFIILADSLQCAAHISNYRLCIHHSLARPCRKN
jgi:hypothetical protein